MELGNQIKKYRSELQISQEQLADRIYVSRQTISNWENEKSYPDVNSLVLLVGTACIYSVWNSFCNYDVLGVESGKGEKGQRYSDIQRDCSLFRR